MSARSPCRDTEVYAQIVVEVTTLGWRSPDLHRISKHTKIKQARLNGWHPFKILSQNFAYFLQQQGSEGCILLCGTKRALSTKLLLYKISSVKFTITACLLPTFAGLLSQLPSPDPLFFDPTAVIIKKKST